MYITWFGQSCFKIQGDQSTLVTDPFDKSYGLKVPRLAADIVTISHHPDQDRDANAIKGTAPDSTPFFITAPGEYEIKKTFIYGVPAYHDDKNGTVMGEITIYRIEIDGVTLVHLGDLGHQLTDAQMERLEGVDVLFVPVGGTNVLDATQAAAVISQLEPRIVIPMHYQLPGLKLKSGKKYDTIDKFQKEMGAGTEEVLKLKVTKKDLPQEDVQIVILKP
ncbi:MAG: hypothetical protein A2840_00640 [Candidatus Buchananbacteria bacterium RIFCSPHIGHO2_01_FULL_47_11b]|uniref:Lactamase n=1 Tax=Candidatus Buchananbacteria bacterium RIFCSPHIGHO2_01_FULL_47_11b TaxID=1797537 RepID=A0A1G1Y2T1_9BACT|nr:MAG: hypothetical protein A2840_00640 [Candidatus Buchananbacteria bacterium RIFCSPHIGHO2_01_FULL_47_11b]